MRRYQQLNEKDELEEGSDNNAYEQKKCVDDGMVEDNQNEARETESDGGLSEEVESWPKEQAVTVDQDKGESCTQSESIWSICIMCIWVQSAKFMTTTCDFFAIQYNCEGSVLYTYSVPYKGWEIDPI